MMYVYMYISITVCIAMHCRSLPTCLAPFSLFPTNHAPTNHAVHTDLGQVCCHGDTYAQIEKEKESPRGRRREYTSLLTHPKDL